MARTAAMSGFPELLPAQRVVEQRLLEILARTFELHGFASVETRAVEPLDQLLSKGETSKEVYVLRRLQAGDGPDAGGDAGIGLHFDLTVPFARYVLENAGRLEFPFRRYQIQKVWRGERPQEGRYREFTQADIDIVGRDTLPFHHDVEVARVMAEALVALPVPAMRLQVNNRKLIQGFYAGIGATDVEAVMRVVDKMDKVAPDAVARMLVEDAGLDSGQAERCLALADVRSTDTSFVERVRALGVQHPLLEEGLTELAAVVEGCADVTGDRLTVEADLRIARGLDYYTGTVFETRMAGFEKLGSICSGGRYDALATDGRTTYPGVGISLGLSRMLVPLLAGGHLAASRPVPSAVLVAVADEDSRAASDRIAQRLRARGVPTEVAGSPQRFGKQIRAAERRGIPFVWFPRSDGGADQVKDIRSGDQADADPASWVPPADDLHPTLLTPEPPSGHRQDPQDRPDHREQGAAPVIRTHDAGSLRAEHVGQTVTLAGWVARRRDHGGVAFIDLRDASGVVQVVIRDEEVAGQLRAEYCVKVTGEVAARPAGNQNPQLPTGEVEVIAAGGGAEGGLEVLSAAAPLPFPVDDAGHASGEVGEEARLRYRYLDLRRAGPNAALRLRSKVNKAARDVLDAHDFVDVETPTLTRSTPEGARDFLVPARLRPAAGTRCRRARSCSSSC